MQNAAAALFAIGLVQKRGGRADDKADAQAADFQQEMTKTHTPDVLTAINAKLAHDAASQLNELLTLFESRTQAPADSADTYELLGEIFGPV